MKIKRFLTLCILNLPRNLRKLKKSSKKENYFPWNFKKKLKSFLQRENFCSSSFYICSFQALMNPQIPVSSNTCTILPYVFSFMRLFPSSFLHVLSVLSLPTSFHDPMHYFLQCFSFSSVSFSVESCYIHVKAVRQCFFSVSVKFLFSTLLTLNF